MTGYRSGFVAAPPEVKPDEALLAGVSDIALQLAAERDHAVA